MKAMILAAGLGTRLRPLTLERAKPAIPLLGKPLLVRLIEHLVNQGVTDFRVNLHHLPETLESIFASPPHGSLPVSFSHEDKILGTAGGLKANDSFFDDGTFVMANADIVTDFPLAPALAFHRERGALATLLLYPQTAPYRYVPVRIDQEGNLHHFKKGPAAPGSLQPTVYVFTGIHILEPEIFEFIPRHGFFEINDQVYPAALRAGKRVLGFPAQGYWNDVGDPARYLSAQREMFLRCCKDPFLCIAQDATVAPGAALGPYVSAAAGCIIEAEASAQDAILWEGAHVTRAAVLRNCIVGSGVSITDTCINRLITRNGEVSIEPE
jgi:NDP-sugar pyrophosphorylase family protein